MISGKMTYLLLVNMSLFALGATLISITALCIKKPSYWWAYVMSKIGAFLVIGTIFIAVWPRAEVEPSSKADWYILGVALTATGSTFVARHVMQLTARMSLREKKL